MVTVVCGWQPGSAQSVQVSIELELNVKHHFLAVSVCTAVLVFTCNVSLADGDRVSTAEPARAQPKNDEEKILNVYNWSNYIGDDTIRNFEKETGIKVNYDIFDSNEILIAKLKAGKSGYDIVVPSAPFAAMPIKANLFRKLDKTRLANLTNLDPSVELKLEKIDPGNNYLVPWMISLTTIAINAKQLKKALGDLPMPANPWDLVFTEKYMSKANSCGVSFVDSPADIFMIAKSYLGKEPYSTNPADMLQAEKMLMKIRPYITLFSSDGYTADLANGALCVVLGWSGDFSVAKIQARAEKNGNEIVTLIPAKGVNFVVDAMAIPADAPHPDNALLWINYILRPDVAAGISNKINSSSPNLAARKYIRKDLLDDTSLFLSEDAISNMTPSLPSSQELMRVQTRAFTRFKSGN